MSRRRMVVSAGLLAVVIASVATGMIVTNGPSMAKHAVTSRHCADPADDIFVGGTGGIQALADPAATEQLRETCGVGLYVHSAVWSGPYHIATSIRRQIAAVFADTGPATIEVGFKTHDLWSQVYPQEYERLGVHAETANVDVFVPGGITKNPISFSAWKEFVDAARRDGVKTVAPIIGLTSGLGRGGDGPFGGPYGSDGKVRPAIQAEYERMASYGGGISLDDPVNFPYWKFARFRAAIASVLRWAEKHHLDADLIVSPGGAADPSGARFLSDTQHVIAILAGANALPTTFSVENYISPAQPPPSGYVNLIVPDTSSETESGVALWLAHYLHARHAP